MRNALAGYLKPSTEINHITSHEDFVPTLVAAVGGGETNTHRYATPINAGLSRFLGNTGAATECGWTR